MGGRRFCNERKQLTEIHGPRCAYCHRYFLDSELSVDHIVPRALSGESIFKYAVIVPPMSQDEGSAIYQVDTNECIQ